MKKLQGGMGLHEEEEEMKNKGVSGRWRHLSLLTGEKVSRKMGHKRKREHVNQIAAACG